MPKPYPNKSSIYFMKPTTEAKAGKPDKDETMISVGLITDGAPIINKHQGGFTLHNLLIGEGFHWQRTIKAEFAGDFMMLPTPQGNIHMVNRLPLERYLESVVGSEMNPEAPIEFLKAHAIISRSWAMRKISACVKVSDATTHEVVCDIENNEISWEESDAHHGFDVCSDDHCQRYQGVPEEMAQGCVARCVEAVRATHGLVLIDKDGCVADARFSKCCGGMTEIFSSCWAEQDPHYLVAQADPWCDLSRMPENEREEMLRTSLKGYDKTTCDFHDWESDVNSEELRERVQDIYKRDLGNILHLTPIERGKSGRITKLKITGSEGKVTIGKTLAIRRLLSADCLKSSWFDVDKTADAFRLQGHGWGHGVGLCQIGAARMAYEGKDCEEILRFYYPGTRIGELDI